MSGSCESEYIIGGATDFDNICRTKQRTASVLPICFPLNFILPFDMDVIYLHVTDGDQDYEIDSGASVSEFRLPTSA